MNPSAFALVGMGAFLAAATHAPIMAIIMIFELTLDYQIILPLMLACVVAYYTSVKIEKRSIYAEALKRKGAGDYGKQLAELHVRDLMKPQPLTVSPTAGFAEMEATLATQSWEQLEHESGLMAMAGPALAMTAPSTLRADQVGTGDGRSSCQSLSRRRWRARSNELRPWACERVSW